MLGELLSVGKSTYTQDIVTLTLKRASKARKRKTCNKKFKKYT